MKKSPLQTRDPRRMEWAFILTLSFLIALFYSFKKFEFTPRLAVHKSGEIIVEKVIVPEIERVLPRPNRPEIPIAGPDDEILKEVTIDPTDVNFISETRQLIPLDNPDTTEVVPFYALSEEPKLIYPVQPEYPELARAAGIQGTVFVEVLIGKNGLVEKARILKSNPMLDDAALAAVRQFRFSPAMQRDKNVRVRISIPIVFKLR